jgi:hypothetical protein
MTESTAPSRTAVSAAEEDVRTAAPGGPLGRSPAAALNSAPEKIAKNNTNRETASPSFRVLCERVGIIDAIDLDMKEEML